MKVPFLDLELQYKQHQSSIDAALLSTLYTFSFIGGDAVNRFETAFADKLQVPHCIATGNGTDSLFIILNALGVGPGDEVIVPAFSCFPSAEAVARCGAKPVFADVDEDHYLLDPDKVERCITGNTKAILIVHLFGGAAAIQELKEIADRHQLHLVEDCAQAHLTRAGSSFAGTLGIAGAFSFYPTKNLGAYGDAGCIVTHDAALAERMRRLGNHGALHKNDHVLAGTNSRMDALQASVLSAKLPFLEEWNRKRRQHATRYQEQLSDLTEVRLPSVREGTDHTFHIYAVRARRRDLLKDWLQTRGIQTVVHYPYTLHNVEAFRYLNYSEGSFPVAHRLPHELLSLPVFPELNSAQIDYVCEAIREFYCQ